EVFVIIVNKMNDWKYTFDPVSKANWLRQIEAELHPRGINSIIVELWPGEKIIPAQHKDDNIPCIKLRDELFSQPPRIMEWIDTSIEDPKAINLKILDALNYGVQSLILFVEAGNKMPFRLWLDGVH